MIKFFGPDGPFGFLSNFYPLKMRIYRRILKADPDSGVHFSTQPETYQSMEHWYMSEKYRGVSSEARQRIISAATALEASRLGKLRNTPIRQDWNQIRLKVMRVGLWVKFSDPEMRQLLANTGDEVLVENSPYDAFWGIGREGNGLNMMGTLLMELRNQIKTSQLSPKVIVAGSRNFTNYRRGTAQLTDYFSEKNLWPSEIISGNAIGADSVGELWAMQNYVPVKHFPARWNDLTAENAIIKTTRKGRKYNARAGIDRNIKMAKYGTHLIAFWDGLSTGTKHMVSVAKSHGLSVQIFSF